MNVRVTVKVLRRGDSVLNVWDDRIAIRRKNGEVDVLALTENEGGGIRLDFDRSWRISYGEDEVEMVDEGDDAAVRGSDSERVKMTTF